MSDYARDAAWSTKGLTPMQRCILLAIAEECEEGSESKPITQKALGGMCECSWLWILRETKKMEDRGILEVVRPSAGEGHQACIYRIVHPDVRKEILDELPQDMQEPKKKKNPQTDPKWLKKKRDTSTGSGSSTRARRLERLVCGSGQGLIATTALLKS